jgi:NAD(P)H-hydrate repair Nnr-like enzyme with NAD(P)H-hydrate epimerase domain
LETLRGSAAHKKDFARFAVFRRDQISTFYAGMNGGDGFVEGDLLAETGLARREEILGGGEE